MTVPISSLCAPVASLAVGSLHDILSGAGQEPPESSVEHPETEPFPFAFRLDEHNEILSKGFPMSLASLGIIAMVIAPISQFSPLPYIFSQAFQTPLLLIFLLPSPQHSALLPV